MGKGGGDLCVEVKVYSSFVPRGASSPHETSYHGDTHAFGNTEERLIRLNHGVQARDGDESWDNATGAGRVTAHRGAYHDALHNKHNTVVLTISNLWGGLNPSGVRHLHGLADRAQTLDRTVYPARDQRTRPFAPHYGRRLAAAIIVADARRCQKRLVGLRQLAIAAAARYAQRRAAPPNPGRPAAP